MTFHSDGTPAVPGRVSHEARGLKSGTCMVIETASLSRLSRGAWIKIFGLSGL